ncbi:TetR/AcrR family transcriptional regulator [uncultured Brevundimonas sp.]|uniref:TetR/AcrR family transcriptional regulator n=1 Tax=uncultured Brevundimonas sp. TaxID=213418 RepID=UPI0030ECF074|tara:strand:+ start:130823 stop:131422 length:600 start_codon:yes stop_codon:yes gene_type:complete
MSRAAGQIDLKKSEAILDAAAELFGEKGAAATMDEIARRAGVSKQTLYNRYASKLDVGRALAGRRSDAVTAPLRTEGDPQTVLTAFAAALLTKVCDINNGASLRAVALISPEAPDIARAIYDGGPGESLRRLSAWLADQHNRGLLCVPDPDHAAEMFSGMALGHSHLRTLLGVDQPGIDHIPQRARETARRFVRAFAPD